MDRTRTLRLRREVLVELTDGELAFRGGNQIVTEVGCPVGSQMLALLRRALSLDTCGNTAGCPTGGCPVDVPTMPACT